MAEFCEKCAEQIGMKNDLFINREFARLQNGDYKELDCICEGCGIYAIEKSKEGEKLVYKVRKGKAEKY